MENLSGTCICPQCNKIWNWVYFPRKRLREVAMDDFVTYQEGTCYADNVVENPDGDFFKYCVNLLKGVK